MIAMDAVVHNINLNNLLPTPNPITAEYLPFRLLYISRIAGGHEGPESRMLV